MSEVLDGRTAVVTGAGSGIGRALSKALSAEGVRVAALGRGTEALRSLADEAGPGSVHVVPMDVRDESGVLAAVAAVRAKLGAVDILVNNAGIFSTAPVVETSTEAWDDLMATNLRGPFLLTRELLPEMIERKRGHVLMNVSVAAVTAFAQCGAYAATKAGLLGFTRVLRAETLGTGVRVTAFLPGATETPVWGDEPPRERLMPAEAVAEAALWALKSDPSVVPEEIILRPPRGDL